MAHETISGYALKLGEFAVPCATVTATRDGSSDLWTIKAFDVPVDALRPLRSAIGPGVAEIVLRLTDYTDRVHESRGRIPRTAKGGLGYAMVMDDLILTFEGHID